MAVASFEYTSKKPRNAAQSSRLRIGIVDDHEFIRDLMQRLFARQKARYEVVCAVGTATEAISACAKLQPDLLILDINLPDRSGVDALPDFKRVTPRTRILLCSAFSIDESLGDLVESGADGFAEKTNSWDDFLDAVQRINRGEKYFSARPRMYSDRLQNSQPTKPLPLTRRETEIVRLITAGLTSKEVACRLGISVATVETHRTNLMRKLGVRNVAGLISRAVQSGLGRN